MFVRVGLVVVDMSDHGDFITGLFDQPHERDARDAALDMLERTRKELVTVGKSVAVVLAARNGKVSSTDVRAHMLERGYGDRMAKVDPRWLGVLFRRGWTRVGYETTGSHGRPVSVWRMT